MRSKLILGWAIAAAVLAGTVLAAEQETRRANGQSKTVRGTLFTARDQTGIVAVSLFAADGKMYSIVIDKRGIELGDKMANRKVEVTGIAIENGRHVIRVQGWDAVLTGRVETVRSAAGNITLVKLIAPEGTYDVALDQKGVELGKKMDGQTVDAVGTIRKKQGAGAREQVVVKSFEEHREPAEAETVPE